MTKWQKSTKCAAGNCVEVGFHGDTIYVRNSTNPDGPVLQFTKAEWDAFVKEVRGGTNVHIG